MESDPTQITDDFPPFFRVHSSGRIERYMNHEFAPAGHDPQTDVVSKDVAISHVSVRLYLPNPKTSPSDPKPPLIFYIHGGGFCIESAFSSSYHRHLNALASQSRSLVVSVEYRLAPEHPIPACYDDSFAALKWVDSHTRPGQGPDPWINDHADLQRVFLAGDSAGANIAHNTLVRARSDGRFGLGFSGLVLIHPFFGLGKPDRVWDYVCPGSAGPDDPRLHPMAHPDVLSGLGCGKVLVCVAEKDFLRSRGSSYYQSLKKSDWNGVVEIFETPGEQHVFHLFNPTCDNAASLLTRIAEFLNSGVRVLSHV
ncbi:probable carboxylesterase 12 [Salvia miltiorrhiza]|uniref:probable carboxylesterase 12 n=1 Tax=Salvia miltiorrhiza TaxID=226208 RepID=UPI0025ACD9BD|nr:probable carboxylesterase 12 [Salvia miltiorrhiza]